MIVSDKADLGVALPAMLFGAVGTCGQRCTTIRRVIAHVRIYDELLERLKTADGRMAAQGIGNPCIYALCSSVARHRDHVLIHRPPRRMPALPLPFQPPVRRSPDACHGPRRRSDSLHDKRTRGLPHPDATSCQQTRQLVRYWHAVGACTAGRCADHPTRERRTSAARVPPALLILA